jgi:hypothetical protein
MHPKLKKIPEPIGILFDDLTNQMTILYKSGILKIQILLSVIHLILRKHLPPIGQI